MPEKVRLQALVSGRVQGVSFRHYTVQIARKLNITGWVRNNRDGTVEVYAEGKREALESLLLFLHTGSPHARVGNVQSGWHEASNAYENFEFK